MIGKPEDASMHTQHSLLAPDIASAFNESAEVVIAPGDCLGTLKDLPHSSMQLLPRAVNVEQCPGHAAA
jgi:hypothetical protein